MKTRTLSRLEPLLRTLRGYAVLTETRPGAFHLDGRDFLHFHEEPDGLVADVRLARGRVRMPAATDAEQAELLTRIDDTLSSLERHRQPRVGTRRPGRRNDAGERD